MRILLLSLVLVFIFCLGCTKTMSSDEALYIAQHSECAEQPLLTDEIYYNNQTNSWKIIIDKRGPAACMYWCEVYQNRTAEVKMMCSGV